MKPLPEFLRGVPLQGSQSKRFRSQISRNFFFFSFFFFKKRAEQMYKRDREHKFRPLHSTRSIAPSELKNKRILGSAPYIFTCVSFILRESSILVLPLIGLQARSRSRNLPGSPMHEEQAFSMHLMISGLAGSRPRCSIALPSLSTLTYFWEGRGSNRRWMQERLIP